jgi:putative sterol carrier protein
MVRFASQEWADAFRIELNKNAEYKEAAAAWEGDLLLLILPDEQAPHGCGIYLDLAHGECRSARYVEDATTVKSEFIFQGKRADWGRVVHREIDPVKALLGGTFQVKGNLAKALRFTRAAKSLVETSALIPTEM